MYLLDEIKNTVFYPNKSDGEPHIGYVLHKTNHTVKIYDFYKNIIVDFDKRNKEYYFLYGDDKKVDNYIKQAILEDLTPAAALNMFQKGKEKKQEFTRTRHMMPTPKKPPHPRKGGRKTRRKRKYKKSKKRRKKRKTRRGYGGKSPRGKSSKYTYSTSVTIKK